MSNLGSYGFKPHSASEGTTANEVEKTVSCKVSPEIWARWRKTQQRLAAHGEIQLAAVVRTSFLKALDDLEIDAEQLESTEPAAAVKGGKSK